MNNLQTLVKEIASLGKKGCRFASLLYTAKGTGEVARHTIAIGVSLENAYRRDLSVLEKLREKFDFVGANTRGGMVKIGKKWFDADLAVDGADELIASLKKSLANGIGNNPGYTCAESYVPIAPGIKLHTESGKLHVYGFSVGKTVIAEGAPGKPVNSAELTLVKNALRKIMKMGKFRQFVLPGVSVAKLNGKNLVFE